ncbi:related to rRNA-processing protein FCF2 [Saccharomycodes ludwigii]|uniref:Related to rRNA-processing protein FCF2 n=1 Tax=Saccharomycodes ludwigii TaxID=36035 RepID=A0A376BBF0_9ASCO|nr:hypothetical protein SCDLUD_000679 [Saccharomycodes ludwigii]KAH3903068.1 hypothetical protein SCDLUD_000679 [Saccharomycodes ludwigii]SSD61957.1 related to rRNA-processing protein FCF2 [Saccharomycodes ludwigii]
MSENILQEKESLDDLFNHLQELEAKKDILDTNKNTGTGFDSNKDELKFEDDVKEQNKQLEFSRIENDLRVLPKLQNNFDSMSKNVAKNNKVRTVKDDILIDTTGNRNGDRLEKDWFSLPKTELTPQIKRDLLLIKHRAALDPKRHYKKDKKWNIPERFSVGTIVEDKCEYYSSRLNKKQRKSNILESLLYEDKQDQKNSRSIRTGKNYFERKYNEIQLKKSSGKRGYYKKVIEKRQKH